MFWSSTVILPLRFIPEAVHSRCSFGMHLVAGGQDRDLVNILRHESA